ITWGHFEELVVLGATITACIAATRGRINEVIVALALALLFKQTALLVLPAILLRLPRGDRARAAAWIVAPTLVLSAACLLFDWRDASRSLLFARSFPNVGWPAPWAAGRFSLVATPFRGVLL